MEISFKYTVFDLPESTTTNPAPPITGMANCLTPGNTFLDIKLYDMKNKLTIIPQNLSPERRHVHRDRRTHTDRSLTHISTSCKGSGSHHMIQTVTTLHLLCEYGILLIISLLHRATLMRRFLGK